MSKSPKQKVYQEVLEEVRKYIDEHHLQSGDKLPSEREMAEKLNAARSSVREAFRAMELLGLIETRRGEGTFLSTYRSYKLVDLLASFILRETEKKFEIIQAKLILEKEAVKLAFQHVNETDVNQLNKIINNQTKNKDEQHMRFFQTIFQKANNHLLIKIWRLMQAYAQTIHIVYYDDMFYHHLIHLYKNREYESIEDLFSQLWKTIGKKVVSNH